MYLKRLVVVTGLDEYVAKRYQVLVFDSMREVKHLFLYRSANLVRQKKPESNTLCNIAASRFGCSPVQSIESCEFQDEHELDAGIDQLSVFSVDSLVLVIS
jgi:hypothetical protein